MKKNFQIPNFERYSLIYGSAKNNDTDENSKQKKRPGRKIGSKDSYKRIRRTKVEIERDRKKEFLKFFVNVLHFFLNIYVNE